MGQVTHSGTVRGDNLTWHFIWSSYTEGQVAPARDRPHIFEATARESRLFHTTGAILCIGALLGSPFEHDG